MAERTQVVVYGTSLHMAGLAASLTGEAGLAVACIETDSPTARQRLIELNPAVVVFDLSDTKPGLDITLLRERPDLLLIGVDPSSDELLVLSGRPAQALTLSDLIDLIRIGGDAGKESNGER